MRKQLRFFGIVIAVALIAYFSIYIAINILIRGEIEKIESAYAQQSTLRAIDALGERLDHYNSKISDWSSWDDTYQFMADSNAEYVASNLTPMTLDGMGLDFIMYFSTKGELVKLASKGQISDTERTALLRHFNARSKFLASSDTDIHKGYLRMAAGPLMFVSRPILDSDGNGPPRGTIVFAHYLTADDAQEISDIHHLNITYFDKLALPEDIKQKASMLSTDKAVVLAASDTKLEGYQLINDAYGSPFLVAEITQDRDSYQSAQHALSFFRMVVAITLLAAATAVMWFIRVVASRDETIKLKDDFFSIASHEIRTPLTAIKGNAQLLTQLYGEKNGQGFVDIVSDIKTSSDRLVRLVTNFLDAARLEQGKIVVKPEPVTIRVVVQEVADELQAVANDKNVTIINSVNDANLRGFADKDHVKQVLYNIIGNALKFTDEGSITITANEVDGRTIEVYITDTGRGVPESGKAALFSKFEQAAKDDAAKGSGLGLYISKLLVEKMGGSIRLVSTEEGKGTTIGFSLPRNTTETTTTK